MHKKTLNIMLAGLTVLAGVTLSILTYNACGLFDNEPEALRAGFKTVELESYPIVNVNTESEIGSFYDVYEQASNEFVSLMNELNTADDKKEWFLRYKDLIAKYNDVLDPPETIYDYYSEDELQRLFAVVEAEVGSFGFEEKCNVASVIFNRLASPEFKADTLGEVLTASQFETIANSRYKSVEISEDTILACEYVFEIGDTTNGALFFESSRSNVHSSYAMLMFSDDSGHKFYK